MKRLKLDDFKSKLNKDIEATDKLLGQALGDCHDSHTHSGPQGSSRGRGRWNLSGGFNVGEIGVSQF